jgi:hypothetical protein
LTVAVLPAPNHRRAAFQSRISINAKLNARLLLADRVAKGQCVFARLKGDVEGYSMFKRSPKSRFRPDLQSAARSGGRRQSFYLASVALPLVAVAAGLAFFEFRAQESDTSGSEPAQQVAMLAPAEAIAGGTISDDAGAQPSSSTIEASLPTPPAVTAKAARPAAPESEPEPAGPAPLSAADPRWGAAPTADAAEGDRASKDDAAARQLAAALQEQGSTMTVEIDGSTTSAVSPDSLAPVEVAETADEVAMLEASVAASEATRPEAAFVVPEPDDTASVEGSALDEPQLEQEPADGLRAATTSGYVNFRTGPSNDAATIEILAAGVAIEASDDCPHFCRVRHNGRNGYIYRSYIAFPSEEPRRQAARQAPKPEAAPQPAETAQIEPEATADDAAAGQQAAAQPAAQSEQSAEDRRNITFFDLIARD